MDSSGGTNIIIIGGGMAGLAAAILLHDKGLQENIPVTLAIYELRPKPETIGGAINLSPNALRILDRDLKLYQTLRAAGCSDVKQIEMFSTSGKCLGTVPFSNGEYDSLRITRSDLLNGLLGGARERGIAVNYSKKLVSISETDASVTAIFADGSSVSGDIILGCDGTHSATRTLLVDPNRRPTYTGISTAYGFSKLDGISADEVYFQRTSIISGQRGSILATYYNSARDSVYFASVMEIAEQSSRDGWRALGEDEEATKAEILRRFGEDQIADSLRFLPKLVRSSRNVCFYPVWKLENNPDAKWFSKRCLLLGDAAHAMPPQGQSIGLAFEDAVLVTRLLFRSRSTETTMGSLPSVFAKYVSIRRPRVDVEFARANSGWETIKDIGWFKNQVREWATWMYLWMLSRGFRAMHEYDIAKVDLSDA